ncbi:hypothetical protein XaC1_38 [Xanthomonas phage XaC1]|nr:hypothetical protein XaC1_38 [Xanthomonas phage XaC1]
MSSETQILVLNGQKFTMTSGARQIDNVGEVLNYLSSDDIKKVRREANISKIAVRRNPVLTRLLSCILLKSSQILNDRT